MTGEQQGEVVIVGKDGTEHVFPPGFDPKKAAAIIAGQALPPAVTPDPDGVVRKAPTAARGTQLNVAGIGPSMSQSAPYVGAAIGAAEAGTPGATVGAGVGQMLKDLQWDMPLSQRAENVAKSVLGAVGTEFGGQAVTKGFVNTMRWAGPKLTSAARSLWLKAAKVPESVAGDTMAAKAAGSIGIPAGRQEIAETVLSQGKGTITADNLMSLRGSLDALDKELDAKIAASTKNIRTQDLIGVFEQKIKAIGNPTSKADEDLVGALNDAVKRLKREPPMMSVQRAQQKKQAIYDYWDYNAKAKEPVKATVDKVLGKELRTNIVKQEPIAGPINSQMSRQIPAVRAMEKAVGRTQNVDPVRGAQMIALAVTNPKTLAGALITIPGVGSFTAQTIYDIGKALPTSAKNPANVIRLVKGLYEQGKIQPEKEGGE